MEEQFREGWRAASFVARGIASDFGDGQGHGDAMLEVTLHKKGAVVRKFCFLDGLERTVRALCAEFPRALVQYHPDSAYGFVAQIRCNCSRVGSEGCCQCGGQDTATVTVVLSREKIHGAMPKGGRGA